MHKNTINRITKVFNELMILNKIDGDITNGITLDIPTQELRTNLCTIIEPISINKWNSDIIINDSITINYTYDPNVSNIAQLKSIVSESKSNIDDSYDSKQHRIDALMELVRILNNELSIMEIHEMVYLTQITLDREIRIDEVPLNELESDLNKIINNKNGLFCKLNRRLILLLARYDLILEIERLYN